MSEIKTIQLPQPNNFVVEIDDAKHTVLSVSCELNGYKYKHTLEEPLNQAEVNRIWVSRELNELPPTPQQYATNCLFAAIFGASRTHHIRNFMNNCEGLKGTLTYEQLNTEESHD